MLGGLLGEEVRRPCEHAGKHQTVIRKFVVPGLNLELDEYINTINLSTAFVKILIRKLSNPDNVSVHKS